MCLKIWDVYYTSCKHDTSAKGWGHNDESATTFPMMISVGDTNSAEAILRARSFNSEKTYKITVHTQLDIYYMLTTGNILKGRTTTQWNIGSDSLHSNENTCDFL